MSKVFLFSGQGAQYVGMGKELYENYESVKNIFDKASEITNTDIKKICFDSPIEELSKTENSQIAITTLEISSDTVLKENGIFPDMVAGFSLGEFPALYSSGVLSLEDTFDLVNKRSEIMARECEKMDGAMVAILTPNIEELIDLCNNIKSDEKNYVEPVNFNTKNQTVVAGTKSGIDILETEMKKREVKVVCLKVSGAFHSKFMNGAAVSLREYMKNIKFQDPKVKIFSNYTGNYINSGLEVSELLYNQVKSPVLWTDIMSKMFSDGASEFYEMGPGKTLCSFIKSVDRKANFINVDVYKNMLKAIENK